MILAAVFFEEDAEEILKFEDMKEFKAFRRGVTYGASAYGSGSNTFYIFENDKFVDEDGEEITDDEVLSQLDWLKKMHSDYFHEASAI